MYEVKIEKMDHEGRGIGYIKDKVTFVKNALPKEVVECKLIEEKKNYNVAEVINYKQISKKRVKPFCPYYDKCAGCNLEHMSYEETIKYKKEKVENILTREKIEYPEFEIIKNPSPINYRNKLSLKIKEGKIGYYEEKTHTLIEIEACPLAKSCMNYCLKNIKKLKIKNGKVTIRANYNEEILLIFETKEKIHWNRNDFENVKIVGVIVNNKTIYGNHFFYERMNGFLFKVSYDAFFQVNTDVTKKMFSLIEENIDNTNVVLDLYSGVGTLGIIASSMANKVYSVEIVKNAVFDNIENKKLNKRENIYPILGDAQKTISKIKDSFDTTIIDPPRKGLDKNSRDILLNSKAEKIIYISCNPLTLTRDLKELTNYYKLEKFYILDMFSYTHHVECVCVLRLR